MFVRTRDWVGPWKGESTPAELRATGSPGAFQVLINGKALAATFGQEGADWHWEAGGRVTIPAGQATIALRDLTGFDGRCAAIYLSMERKPALPDAADAVRQFRGGVVKHGPVRTARFDFVVVGGGVAGLCASLAAARRGLKVALIHNRPVLGGNSSSEVRVSPNSARSVEPYPGLGSVLAEFDWNRTVTPLEGRKFAQGDDARLNLVRAEPNLSLFLNHHVFQVDKRGSGIRAAMAQDILTGAATRFEAGLFADCSGDANLGYLAGAEWRLGRESKSKTAEPRAVEQEDSQVLGSTLHWHSRTASGSATSFPELPWALPFTEEKCQYATEGAWDWETGFHLNQATQTETVRDHMLRAIYGNWAFQKNRSNKRDWYRDLDLAWTAHVLGKRESRRLMGDVVLSQLDLDSGKAYPDGMVACDWGIDIHLPNPRNSRQFAGWAFRAIAEHFDRDRAPMRWMPYRCLYSRNIGNLFMAGRNASSTHVAFAWFRNQRTTAMMGELVGLAAAICLHQRATPRGVYERHLPLLQAEARAGAGKPGAPSLPPSQAGRTGRG